MMKTAKEQWHSMLRHRLNSKGKDEVVNQLDSQKGSVLFNAHSMPFRVNDTVWWRGEEYILHRYFDCNEAATLIDIVRKVLILVPYQEVTK